MSGEASREMEEYFAGMNLEIKKCYELANKARKKGLDPEDRTDIPLAKNMAERVERLVGAIVPQIINSGIPKRIYELESKYGKLDWRVALKVSLETAQEKFCKFPDKQNAMEAGIRIGLAYLTLGVVASPLEGFVGLKLRKRRDGGEYFALMYSGPIRSAGGTGAAVSVIVADYIRSNMGYLKYDPEEKETKRTATELYDYHERITNLQYLPSEEEIMFLVKHLPVQIDGDPSEDVEVSNFKGLDRIETNKIRSGVCLVIGESLAQKAPKVWARLSKWGKEEGLQDWLFLEEFVKLQKQIKSRSKADQNQNAKILPDYTFIKDLVAGRPVLTHPMREGGFRLRYGRSRTSGYSAASIHPATMHILNNYIATGTQLKVERPGKAASVTQCDTIEGPVVRLINGNVVRLDSAQKAKEVKKEVSKILFLGDILFNYGDFFNRAHPLAPAGYCEEWWSLEMEKASVELFGTLDWEKIAAISGIPAQRVQEIINNPLYEKPSASEALSLCKSMNVPLHPRHTYHWRTLNAEGIGRLMSWLESGKLTIIDEKPEKAVLQFVKENKDILEAAGIPHINASGEFIILEKEESIILSSIFCIYPHRADEARAVLDQNRDKSPLDILALMSGINMRDKSGTFIGARMGRPEKAKMRKLTGNPHVLFPVGEEGGKLRSFQSALDNGKITAEFPVYVCSKCAMETIFPACHVCGKKADKGFYCSVCGVLAHKCEKKDTNGEIHRSCSYRKKEVDIKQIFERSTSKLGESIVPDLIKGVRGTSNEDHAPEHLIKGILRSKNDVFVNKDGTIRYDITQLPITHFKPKEISVPIEKLLELGYKADIHGKELMKDDQILEIKPQDIILPACRESPDAGADKVFFNAATFIDELLSKFYDTETYYGLKEEKDLIGCLFMILAPHTSAATVCRLIGFSNTQGLFAHPLLHAATRRDCDGDEASVILLMDGLLNFSRKFLPHSRGATQDAPLVLTSRLVPAEVDDMVFDMDIEYRYPLAFYEATTQSRQPGTVDIARVGKVLNTPRQYEGMGFTHDTSNINSGVRCSSYKILPSMEDKLKGQMDLADKIRAVDAPDVARLVIEKHFIRDIRGNLRKFSMQQFRCVSCNEKFRRPPLIGKCKCGGRIIFTVSEGSIIKYLEPSISLANKYNLPDYLKQNLELTKQRVESVFGKEKDKQEGLAKWF